MPPLPSSPVILLGLEFPALLDEYEHRYLRAYGRERVVNEHRLDHLRKLTEGTSISSYSIEKFLAQFSGVAHRNRYRALLRGALRWGFQQGWVLTPIDLPVLKMEPEHNQRTRRLSKTEETRLVVHMGEDLRDLFYAALDTGLRYGALKQVTFDDVDFANGVIIVRPETQKTHEAQRIPMTARLRAILKRRTQDMMLDSPVFRVVGFKEQWAEAKRKAGIRDFHWHDLRGEFASRLDEAGVEVSVTSRLLGHRNLMTTQRYLRPRTERFREAIDRLGV